MVIYCPLCGTPVDVELKTTTIHVNQKGNLVVVIPDVVVKHQCAKPQDA